MSKKTLSIIESAYRATIEEQDDTIVWINHAMKGAGCDLTVLLRGNAVNYGVKGQNAGGITIGGWTQAHPPAIENDVTSLIGKGVDVYVVEDDVAERGLERSQLIEGLKTVSRSGTAKLVADHARIWYW